MSPWLCSARDWCDWLCRARDCWSCNWSQEVKVHGNSWSEMEFNCNKLCYATQTPFIPTTKSNFKKQDYPEYEMRSGLKGIRCLVQCITHPLLCFRFGPHWLMPLHLNNKTTYIRSFGYTFSPWLIEAKLILESVVYWSISWF